MIASNCVLIPPLGSTWRRDEACLMKDDKVDVQAKSTVCRHQNYDLIKVLPNRPVFLINHHEKASRYDYAQSENEIRQKGVRGILKLSEFRTGRGQRPQETFFHIDRYYQLMYA